MGYMRNSTRTLDVYYQQILQLKDTS